ncbi:MAG: hypothetical protein QOE32_6848 [Pseudonocardiales bacterium]|jgi:predicted RNA-binding Zn ribbon-like protein|nr:hypothetical protein [Pseudonocardiales bacterium]
MVRTKASERPYFPMLGAPLALDFLNTELWREGSTVDLIGDPHRWKQWLGYQQRRLEPILGGPVTAQMRSAGPPRRVRELRDAARVVIDAARTGQPRVREPGATLNAAVAVAPITGSAGGFNAVLYPVCSDIEALLGALAVATADLATSPQASAIHQCQADGCGLLFLPTHPARRWCGAWTCGNRTRAARLYQPGPAAGGGVKGVRPCP